MADEEASNAEEETSSGGGLKKIILLVVMGLVLIGASVGGTLFFLGGDKAEEGGDAAAAEAAAEPEDTQSPAVYVPIKPALVINFMSNGRRRLLEVSVTIMSRDMDVVTALQSNIQLVKHNLNNVIASHAYEELQTDEGKELMRQAALKKMQTLMQDEIGNDQVEQVLFESFVMQ